jgi:hypothetical protein
MTQKERTGNQTVPCVAAAIVDWYNRGLNARSDKRLPSWWKDCEEDAAPASVIHPRARATSSTTSHRHDLHV